jgi:hypothetical protein
VVHHLVNLHACQIVRHILHLGIIQAFYAHMNHLQKKSNQHVGIHKKQYVMNHNLSDDVVASIFVIEQSFWYVSIWR